MKTANIATAKNQLSRLLKRVQRGETILITDRDHPVARLQPVEQADSALEKLHATGVLNPPSGPPLDVSAFLSSPRARLTAKRSLTSAVLSERKEGR